MLEVHPWGNFVPKNCRYLFLGSFPGKLDEGNNWFYGSKRNQFWKILEAVYGRTLSSIAEKQKLLKNIRFAMADVILSCERKKDTNLDANLTKITYNKKAITKILRTNKIKKIFFTSKFVENLFKNVFPNHLNLFPVTNLYTLPSPSPRFAKMTLEEKIRSYRKLLPFNLI
ncbi:MAG: hypothetical protein UT39_C0002G0073 [Candidatus Woesebacteria bacterium GW2011_GWA1_39_21]|uniref:Uracil-DNA glycosylase-like domain-containing protein n=1 Tax=Candidatus Woesebacteria bacterium GW2011_GWA1_39_21 TaxID=1618550 RepID=A0A0G0RDY7_9BACT|nr:MAG: hypothetical protein UT39_C0002G0073 [Candidatus Woesebacteria bacterium GW2011_GWA1_39_21]